MEEMQAAGNVIIEQKLYINNVSGIFLFVKRFFDIAISLSTILLLSLIFCAISVWIKMCSKGTVLHTEEKFGFMCRKFKVYEFNKIVNNPYLRKLPLFFNVLAGSMSLVGPQPASVEDPMYDTWYYLRLSAKPGITGLWQVSGKTGGMREMVRVDLKYIRERSIRHDIKIMLKSVCLILGGKKLLNE